MVFEGTEKQYSMDGYLYENLKLAKTVIKKDWDMLFIVDGYEGSGKSVMAQQMAFFCDPTLTNERVVFTPKGFRKAIMGAEKYQAVVYDEAYTGLSSRATMSLINRTLTSMLAEIRQRNLFVFVVMPCFFDLDRYVALWRGRALIHVYTADGFERGYLAFYNVDKKKDLYITGKKFYSYKKPRPNFTGRFPNHYTVDEKEYKKNKRNSLIDREKKVEEAEKLREVQSEMFRRFMELKDDIKEKIPNHIQAQILGISEVHYYRKRKQWEEGI